MEVGLWVSPWHSGGAWLQESDCLSANSLSLLPRYVTPSKGALMIQSPHQLKAVVIVPNTASCQIHMKYLSS